MSPPSRTYFPSDRSRVERSDVPTPELSFYRQNLAQLLDRGETGPLQRALRETPDVPLRLVFARLSGSEQDALAARIGREDLRSLFSLSEEADPECFFAGLIALAAHFESVDKLEVAAGLYSLASRAEAFPSLQRRAASGLDAILGRGSLGPRVEFLLRRFARDATDYRMIVPMLAGSTVAGLVRTTALGRLTAWGGESFLARDLGARWTAGTLSYLAEVPTFVGTERLLRGMDPRSTETSVGHDLASAALTLGSLRIFGLAGDAAYRRLHQIDTLGTASRFASIQPFTRTWIPQATLFGGLLTSQHLEQALGLRPRVDGATTVTDTLASMFSLGVGARLGHQLLGADFAAFHQGLELRTRMFEHNLTSRSPHFPTRNTTVMAGVGTGLMLLLAPGLAHSAIEPGLRSFAEGDLARFMMGLGLGLGVWAISGVRPTRYRYIGSTKALTPIGNIEGARFGPFEITLKVYSTSAPIIGPVPRELAHRLILSLKDMLTGGETVRELPKGPLAEILLEGDKIGTVLSEIGDVEHPRLVASMRPDRTLLKLELLDGGKLLQTHQNPAFMEFHEDAAPITERSPSRHSEPSAPSPGNPAASSAEQIFPGLLRVEAQEPNQESERGDASLEPTQRSPTGLLTPTKILAGLGFGLVSLFATSPAHAAVESAGRSLSGGGGLMEWLLGLGLGFGALAMAYREDPRRPILQPLEQGHQVLRQDEHGHVQSLRLSHDEIVQDNVLPSGSQIRLDLEHGRYYVELSRDLEIQGLLFSKGSQVELDLEGRLRAVALPQVPWVENAFLGNAVAVAGRAFLNGSRIRFDSEGNIVDVRLPRAQMIDGIPCSETGNVVFDSKGRLRSFRLAHTANLWGQTYPGGVELTLDEGGAVSSIRFPDASLPADRRHLEDTVATPSLRHPGLTTLAYLGSPMLGFFLLDGMGPWAQLFFSALSGIAFYQASSRWWQRSRLRESSSRQLPSPLEPRRIAAPVNVRVEVPRLPSPEAQEAEREALAEQEGRRSEARSATNRH